MRRLTGPRHAFATDLPTTRPTTTRRRRFRLFAMIGRVIASLPRVEPYMGPTSLQAGEGERRQVLNGRVIVTRRK